MTDGFITLASPKSVRDSHSEERASVTRSLASLVPTPEGEIDKERVTRVKVHRSVPYTRAASLHHPSPLSLPSTSLTLHSIASHTGLRP